MKNAILSYAPPFPWVRVPALVRSHELRSRHPGLDLRSPYRKLWIPKLAKLVGQAPLRLGRSSWLGALWGRDGWDVARIVERDEARLLQETHAARVAHRPARPIALGGTVPGDALFSDPYSRDQAQVTTALLEMLDRFEGLALSLTTRQPRVLENLELLTHLDGKHAVTVTVPLETDAPAPNARLRTIRALAARGLTVQVLLASRSPTRPDTRRLARLFDAVAEAGAQDVQPGWSPPPASFERLRLAYGFPRSLPGRG